MNDQELQYLNINTCDYFHFVYVLVQAEVIMVCGQKLISKMVDTFYISLASILHFQIICFYFNIYFLI